MEMPKQMKWTIEWTNPNGSSDGDVVVAVIKTDPKRPGTTAYTVPQYSVVVIRDLFKDNVSIGGDLEFVVNDLEIVYRSPDVSKLDASNPSRPYPPAIALYPGDTLKINVYVKANNTGSDVTETVTLLVDIYTEDEFPY